MDNTPTPSPFTPRALKEMVRAWLTGKAESAIERYSHGTLITCDWCGAEVARTDAISPDGEHMFDTWACVANFRDADHYKGPSSWD